MKTMLITGGSGFLGKRIAAFYREHYQILTPAHSQMDILDEKAVAEFVQAHHPDFVIHCAGMADTALCEQESSLSWDLNVDGAVHVAKAAKTIGAKFILCSSDQVYYSCKSPAAHRESELLHPFPLYGVEKLQAEQDALKVNPDSVILRLSWMYDIRSMEPEHGDFFRILTKNLKGTGSISFPVYDMRGITDVNLVVANLQKALELPGGVYNFGSPNDRDTFHMMESIFKALNLPADRLVADTDSFHRQHRNLTMDPEKLNGFGIRFPHTEAQLLKNLQNMV